MSTRFTDYHAAYEQARQGADRLQLDHVIRAVKEYGKAGYNVSIACRNDSDYARYEIVRPGSPKVG